MRQLPQRPRTPLRGRLVQVSTGQYAGRLAVIHVEPKGDSKLVEIRVYGIDEPMTVDRNNLMEV